MPELEGAPPLNAGPPFADWREQLRERVKEIRARKMNAAGHDPIAPEQAAAATAEKLRAARQAARAADAAASAAIAAPTDGRVHAQDPGRVNSPSPPPEPDLAAPSEMPPATEPSKPSPVGDAADSHTQLPEQPTGDPLPVELPPPPDAEDVPLFQEEPTFFETADPPPPVVPDTSVNAAESASVPAAPPEPEPAVPATPKAPIWAKPPAPEAPAVSARPVPPPDPDAIPPDMQDVEIPAWALPRRRPSEIAADELAHRHPDDVHLVGEFVSSPEPRRPDRVEPSEPPAPEPAPPESSPQQATPVSGGLSHGFFDEPAPPGSEAEPAAPATTAVPHLDLPATPPPELVGQERVQHSGRSIPGLFDPSAEPPPAPAEAPPWRSLEGQSDAIGTAGPQQGDSLLPTAPETETAPALEATPTQHAALEWDLDAPTDPETILEAQRERLDPSATISDRVFSSLADAVVLLAIAVILSIAGARAAGTGMLSLVASAPVPFIGAWALFAFVYGVFFVGTCGQTLGKMAMRVRVIGAHHFRVGYTRAAQRAVWYALAATPAFLGLMPALRDPEHRALHDRLSGTRVVKA